MCLLPDDVAALTDPDVELPGVSISDTEEGRAMLASFRGNDWESITGQIRRQAREHIYFNCIHCSVNPESAFAMYEACGAQASPQDLADFIECFYNDLNPMIAGLRRIDCPCLMILGEHDVQFIKPAELVAREVPGCTHRVLAGMGHMLAFENPQRLGDELLKFLDAI